MKDKMYLNEGLLCRQRLLRSTSCQCTFSTDPWLQKVLLVIDLFRANIIKKKDKNEVNRGVAVETATSENPANVCSAQLCLRKIPFYEGHAACHMLLKMSTRIMMFLWLPCHPFKSELIRR